jgi:hypothetical protein
MVQPLGTIKLKSGEIVEAGVVRGPDLAWSQRLQKLLWHKGDPWNWQNAQVLEANLGLDVNFYILHRDGNPFANIMTIELAGVGHFGHVWTQPADRQQGASRSLMGLQMQDFVERGGKALFLGTGYDSSAYRIYASHGFASIEPESGHMAYYSQSQDEFEASYFVPGQVSGQAEIQPLAWRHWPASAPLFLGNFPGLVRCAPLQLIGRASTEGALLSALIDAAQRQREAQPPTVLALCNLVTTAVVGLAAWSWHPLWPNTCLVDCYCHPQHWGQAAELLGVLQLPTADRTLAYIDNGNEAKAALFAQAGYQPVATLPKWLATDHAKREWVDVTVWQKSVNEPAATSRL